LTDTSYANVLASSYTGCLYTDPNSQTLVFIQADYITSDHRIVINLPFGGIFYFVAIPVPILNAPFDILIELITGISTTLNYPDGFTILVTTDAVTSINVNFSTQSTYPSPNNKVSLDAYFDISLSVETTLTADLIYYIPGQSTLQQYGVNGSTIELAYYDTVTGVWEFLGCTMPNGTYITCPTTHFSTWGVFGAPVPRSTTGAVTSMSSSSSASSGVTSTSSTSAGVSSATSTSAGTSTMSSSSVGSSSSGQTTSTSDVTSSSSGVTNSSSGVTNSLSSSSSASTGEVSSSSDSEMMGNTSSVVVSWVLMLALFVMSYC